MAVAIQSAEQTIDEFLDDIYDPEMSRHDLAIVCQQRLGIDEDDEILLKATYFGFMELLRQREQKLWHASESESAAPRVRSGHGNSSGRFRGMAELHSRGILDLPIQLDGTAYLVGSLTSEICDRLKTRYEKQELSQRAGRLFFERLEQELRKKRKQRVEQLGQRVVEKIRKETRFRLES